MFKGVIDKFPELGPGGLAGSHLTDGQKITVECQKCRKKLCIIWITQPKLDVYSKISANCDYCGHKSPHISVKGKFHIGHTNDSNIIDVSHDFVDGESGKTGIYQKADVITKRTK